MYLIHSSTTNFDYIKSKYKESAQKTIFEKSQEPKIIDFINFVNQTSIQNKKKLEDLITIIAQKIIDLPFLFYYNNQIFFEIKDKVLTEFYIDKSTKDIKYIVKQHQEDTIKTFQGEIKDYMKIKICLFGGCALFMFYDRQSRTKCQNQI